MSTFPFIYFNKYKSEKVTLNDYGMTWMIDIISLIFYFYKSYLKHLK